jgi:hypothetical protein
MSGLPLQCAATIGYDLLIEIDRRWDVFQLSAAGYALLAAPRHLLPCAA